ncbi:GNAT family N-acetyltransferase [Paenibacillus sp. IITD108]|uniref:GNAT family N-acetyltransferase n=1 Tax=Paenibacillus sp. IITD108 TaxID=3116649 RepID=UPI002F4255C7
MKIEKVTLEGSRVMLLPLGIQHIEPLYQALDDEQIWTYLPGRMENFEDMSRLVTDALDARQRGEELPFVVYDKETQKIVGMTRLLNISEPNRSVEIGYTWYSASVWRTRVNTESKFLLLKHCFEELRTVRVQLKTDRRNTKSNQAITRIGAKLEGVLRKERILQDGYIRDSVYYSIIDDEWDAVKQGLIAMLDQR